MREAIAEWGFFMRDNPFSLESLILTMVGTWLHVVAFAEIHFAPTVTQHRGGHPRSL